MRGILFILGSEIWFSLASFFTKTAWTQGQIPGAATSFFRFLLGFILAGLVLRSKNQGFKPRRWDLVTLRGVLNSSALVVFAFALQGTALSKANTLNMTYPLFVFLIAPFVTGQKAKPLAWVLVIGALVGTFFILQPDWRGGINAYDLLGLASGIIAALGVTSLDLARKFDGTFMIIFWMMGIGSVVSGLSWGIQFALNPHPIFWGPGMPSLLLASVSGVLGQVFITYGYGYVDARTGSVLSSSRIVFASLLGYFFLAERPDGLTAIGIVIVLASVALTGWAKAGQSRVKN